MKKKPNILKMAVYAVILIGVFTGLLETASASANINVADNGHYFEYDGQQEFLVGLGSWTPINHNDFDYTAHNQWYQSYGINYNRITLTSTWYTDHSKQVFPWKRSTTPGANDGGNKFDLNDWDPVFWDRLKGYLQDCKDRGITVCIQFFDECAVEYGSQRWNQHPFNPQNNINNIPDLDTTDASYSSSTEWSKSFYNVDNSVLMTLQDIYVQKLLDETSQYGNIIYEMANEYGGEGSTQFPGHFAWPQHWIDFFSNYEAAGVPLLLTNMPFGGSYNQAEYFAASGIDCIDAYRQFPSYSDVQGVNDFLGSHYNKGKPIFSGKIGNDVGEERGNVNDNRKRLWTLLVSGGAGSGIKGSCWGIVDWTDDTTMEEMVLNIHIFIDAGIGFWNMVPKDNLVTSGTAYCLANPGNEYVVYLPEGGSVTVDLSGATGTLNVEWYDPKEGTYYDEETITGGGSETFTPPFSGDAVLHILLSTGVNNAPVAQDQPVTTDEDTPKAITLVATDVDGDVLTYSIVTQPLHGTLSGAAPNVTYTPDANYNGLDSFSFKANDGTADSNVAAVSITVTSVNDAPVAQDQSVTTAEDTARAITLVATDVDGNTLTYSIVTQPLHGTLSGAAPNMTYTPDANYNGSDSFTFKANDGTVDSNVAIVSITVPAINDAPVAQDQPVTTDEDTATAITLVATDVDGDTLTYSIVTQPSHGTLGGTAPNMTYTPYADYHGSDSFTFKANDSKVDSNVAIVSITVPAINDAPVAQDQPVTTDEDTATAITLVATDVDGDTLTYSIVTQPSHGTLGGTAPNMTYTPYADYHGSDSFTFKANDGTVDSNVAIVSITVPAINDAPVAQDQSVTTDEDTATAITLVATDVDGDTLTYSIVTQPSHGTLGGTAPNMTYTPYADYHGSDSFTFKANDGTVDSNVAAVSITVTSVNDAPVAQDQSVTTTEDTPTAITLVATDVDGDTLTYSIVTQPLHGTVSGAAPNMTYTPDTDYNGSDSFTFKANDSKVDSNVATVSITVTSVNDSPVAQDQPVTTDEDTAKSITLVATDVDGDTLRYSIVTQPLYGTLSGAAPNVTYTPDANYHGSDSFTFKANDSKVDSNVAIVSITVTAINDAPVAQDQPVTTDEDTARAITLVATDVDGNTLTYSIVTQPLHGTLGGTAPNVTYTPDADYIGSDSFTFRANDGTVDSNVAAVSITVTSVNDAPVAQDQSVTTTEDTPTAITLVATDVDGDTLTYSTVTQPSHGTLSGAAPNVTYTPDANYHGSDSFTFKANDGLLDSNVATVSITVGSELIISNLMVASGKSYEVVYSGLVEGAFQYIDRSYTFSAVPGSITGATYIKTANNDKNRAEPDFLCFDVNQAVTIYVAHDDRIVPRPSWLHDFVDTGEDMLSDDPECSPFSLFINDFPQGTLSLGGNIDSSIPADTKRSMYTVVIVGNGSNHPPVADPNGPYTGTEGVPIAYDENGSYDPDGTIVSYLWTFGDGNNATEVNPTHIYAQDGTYTVLLTVTDNDDATDTSTTTATIADTEPTANFSASPTCGPEPSTVTFCDHSTSYDGIIAWDWDFDSDGIADSTAQNPTHAYAEDGVYTVSLTVYESDGDSDSMTKVEYIMVIRVNQPPVSDPNGPYTGTEGVPILFNGSGSYDLDGSIIAYEWDFGDGSNATGVTLTHTYAQNGAYTVTLTVTDNDGATNTSTTTATIADIEPIADFSASPTSGPEPLTVTFCDHSASYDGIIAWDWDFDSDGVTDSTEQNPTLVYAEEGIYTVCLTVTESDGDRETMTKVDYISVTKVNNAPYKPANPSPSDGATDVPVDAVLSWTGGDPDAEDTVTYDVYTGTSISPPLVAENHPGATYGSDMLDYSTEYYWRIVAKDNHGAFNECGVWSFTTASSPGSDLAAEWHLDEGTGEIAADTSGNGNDGALVNNPAWVNGKVGKGLSFDGTNDYIDCGQSSSLKITGAITVEAWVKWEGAGNPYFVTKTGGPGRRSFDLSGNEDGTVEFRVGGADCNSLKSSGTISIPAGEWVHLVGTYEPSSYVRLFVDGALAKENIVSIPASQGDNGLLWYIGAREGNQGWFNGVIDEVKIYNRALSAEEVQADYEAGCQNNPPTAFIDSIVPDPAEQGKDTVSFTGHGTDTDGSVVAYNWSSSIDGMLSTASSFSKPASELLVGTHTIYFKVQDNDGAWSTEVTDDLTILGPANQPPVSDPNGPYTGTEGVPIAYDGSGTYDPDGSIVAYEWDFGDGNTATGVTPTHIYAHNGTYTVILTVTDNDGVANTSTTTAIIADTEPIADFSASPTSGPEPLTVTFSDHSASYDGIITWDWDFDSDGVADSTAQNPTHAYAEEGVYTVSLTVYESDGDSDSMTEVEYIMVIKVNQPPVSDPNGPYTGTEGVPILFNGSGSYDLDGSIIAYEWDFGDGSNATGVTLTHTYAQNGAYTVTLTVTDNDGATNTSTTTATIADTEPIADFSASPTSGPEPLTVTFCDHSTSYDGIIAWEWDFDNDGVTDSTEQNPTLVYAEDGIYTVCLTVTESDGDRETMTKVDYISVTKVNNAPYKPANPSPSDGATDVPVDAVLSWTGGDPDAEDTVTYDVYTGTSISPPLVAENHPGTTYGSDMRDYSTEYYWQVVATDNHGAYNESEVWSFTTASAPGSDLAAEWHLDEGSGPTAVDTSGNGNDGALVNNPAWVNGKVGKGLSFDGTDDYIVCGQSSSLKITGAITVEAWVKWLGAGNPYFVTKTGGPGRRSFDLSGNEDGTVEFRVGGADCNSLKSSGTISIPAGEWVHLVGTYEPSSYVRLFVNGALAKENTVSIPASQGDNGLPWYIGAREGNQGWFNGIIDEVKIYNGALSAEEV